METVLVTAAGSASAHAVVESLHAMGYRVVCCDIYPRSWNSVSSEGDAFFQSIPASDPGACIRQLKEQVLAENCRYLIPLTDPEVDILAPLREEFTALGCCLCVPEADCVQLCRDKLAMARYISDLCQTIPTYPAAEWEPDSWPVMLKPVHGRSSQAQHIVHDLNEYREMLRLRDDYIAQPFIQGDVYCVDVARDSFGQVQALTRRELLRTVNGLGTTVRILPGHILETICARIAEKAGITGVVNMEFIGNENGFFFLEVNPRFSGGTGFSKAAGCDFAELEMACHQSRAIGPRKVLREVTVSRRIESLVTEEGTILA